MNGHVLVLNQDYQPLSVCGVRKSLMLLFLEKAELLHPLSDRKIQIRFNRANIDRIIVFYQGERMGEARPLNPVANDRKPILNPQEA